MFVFDISNPLTLVLMLVIIILLIFLSQEVKKLYSSYTIICIFNIVTYSWSAYVCIT